MKDENGRGVIRLHDRVGPRFITRRRYRNVATRITTTNGFTSINERLHGSFMRVLNKTLCAVSLLAAMTGCSRAKPIGLAIEGYNYTNRYIDSFTVTDQDGNGAWGGNIFLSSSTSGGGKSTCCVMLDLNAKRTVRLRIDWTIGKIDDASGHTVVPEIHKNTWVTVSPPFPTNPQNFEVHFYPDGHVEAAVTHWSSPPRIKLPDGRTEQP